MEDKIAGKVPGAPVVPPDDAAVWPSTDWERALVREIWKADLDPIKRRRWSWVASVVREKLAVENDASVEGVAAMGWGGEDGLEDKLNNLVSAEPGVGCLVIFEGANHDKAIVAAKEAVSNPGSKLQEVAIIRRNDVSRLCHMTRIVAATPEKAFWSGLVTGVPVEGGAITRAERHVEAPVAETGNESERVSWFLRVPETDEIRFVGVISQRIATLLKPGHWVILTRTGDGKAFATGRISRQPEAGSSLLVYDRLAVFDEDLDIGSVSGRAIRRFGAAPKGILLKFLGMVGLDIEQVPVPNMKMVPQDIIAELGNIDLESSFVNRMTAALNSRRGLILVGDPGSGRTSLALALARAGCRAGLTDLPAEVVNGSESRCISQDASRSSIPDNPFRRGSKAETSPSTEGSTGLIAEAYRERRWAIIDDATDESIRILTGQMLAEELRSQSNMNGDSAGLRVIMTTLKSPAPSRLFIILPVPQISRNSALRVVSKAGLLTDAVVRRKILQMLDVRGLRFSYGIMDDIARYVAAFEAGHNAAPTAKIDSVDRLSVLRDALELCLFPYLDAHVRDSVEAVISES